MHEGRWSPPRCMCYPGSYEVYLSLEKLMMFCTYTTLLLNFMIPVDFRRSLSRTQHPLHSLISQEASKFLQKKRIFLHHHVCSKIWRHLFSWTEMLLLWMYGSRHQGSRPWIWTVSFHSPLKRWPWGYQANNRREIALASTDHHPKPTPSWRGDVFYILLALLPYGLTFWREVCIHHLQTWRRRSFWSLPCFSMLSTLSWEVGGD